MAYIGKKEFSTVFSVGEEVNILHGFYNKGKKGRVVEIRFTSDKIEYKVDTGELTSYYYLAEDLRPTKS